MDLSFYKLLHVTGIIVLFIAFGGLTLGARIAGGRQFAHRRLYTLLHGFGLAFLIFSGFGQLAKIPHEGMPTWVIIKLVLWLGLGLILSVILRAPQTHKYIWATLVAMGVVAGYMGIFKPI